MIRIAYDVSAAVPYPGANPPASGIGRVIREVISRLVLIDGLQIRAVGCFGGDWNPISTSLRAEAWAQLATNPPVEALRAYSRRTGFFSVLGSALLHWEADCARRNSREPILLRLLRNLARRDVRLGFSSDTFDLFCATFLPPPAFLAPTLPRVFFIYDVIPLRLPTECGAVPQAMLRSVLDAIDPVRDVVVAISEFSKKDFCDLTGFPETRVVVAPLAASPSFQPIDSASELDRIRQFYGLGAEPYLLSVANPQPRKNLTRTIRAFFQAVRALPQWKGNLVLAGNDLLGWGGTEIRDAISEEPALVARVKSVGAVSENDLAALYSGCDGFIFPSLYEGFGLPVLEAMQCGAPVVCSNTTSLPEAIGDAGLLVDPGNQSEIAEAMQNLIVHPDVRSELSIAGLAQATRFSWERTASCVSEAFKLAITSRESKASASGPFHFGEHVPQDFQHARGVTSCG